MLFFTQKRVVKKQYSHNKKQYSFRVFLRFWLAKITRIIHHNQLLFRPHLEEYFAILNQWRQKWSKLPDYWTVNREDLDTRLSCFVSESKNGGTFHLCPQEEIGEIGQIARAVRRQLEGRHLLFGEYLWTWTTLYLSINVRYRRWT